ncbi:MAG: hypothetical protein AAF787_07875 [Chloroflexota bacterium]
MERTTQFTTQPQGHTPRRGYWQVTLQLAVILLCTGLGIASHAPTVSAQQTPTDIQQKNNPFGIVEGFWFPEMTCDLGVGWERIIFDWAQHQPEGPTDWFTLNVDDRWLKAANQCNREVVALLKNTPAWATSGIPGAGIPNGLYLPVDDPDNHWANFVRQSASYYAPRGVNRFIIWNEPDISRETYGFEFEGELEDYFQMVRVASIAAKQGNPAAEIHLAGTTYWHDRNEGRRVYLDRLLERITQDEDAAAHGYYFDAISLHIYFRTDSVYDIVNEARQLLDSYGLEDKAIWINETNAPPTQDPEWPVNRPVFQYTLEQQAAFVMQGAALGKAAGAERIAVYKLYDQQLPEGGETFGILRPADQSTRPAFDAWQTVNTLFYDVESAARFSTETADSVVMTMHDDGIAVALWSRDGEDRQITITADAGTVYGHLDGSTPVDTFEGETTLTLPAANCNGDDPEIPCPVGGAPVIVMVNGDSLTIQEIQSDGTIASLFEQ